MKIAAIYVPAGTSECTGTAALRDIERLVGPTLIHEHPFQPPKSLGVVLER